MICPKCGAVLSEGAQFCGNCGAQIGAPQQPQYQTPQQPQTQQPAYSQTPQQPQTPQYQAPQQPPAYPQMPRQPAFQAAAPQQTPGAKVPWHSRGKLSPAYSGAKRLNFLLIAALTVIQAVLFFIFASIGDTVEADMMTAQIVGIVPTVVLIVYLFCLDSIEKEPPLLLLKLFLVEGVLTMLVVAYVELAAESVALLVLDEDTLLYQIVDNLLCVALVEELFKYAVLKRFTWKHPAFNYRFDGVVYAAVTALGFAAFENFAYIDSYGFGTALIRTVSAVPGHCVDGILMGIFYGRAKLLEGRGDHAGSARNRLLAILAPIAEHGFYDFFAGGESEMGLLLFYAYVFILNASVFVLVWRLAQKDEAIYRQPPQYAAW